MKDFFLYIKSPDIPDYRKLKVSKLFKLLGFCIITSIILGIIIYGITDITGLERNKMFEKSKYLVIIGFLVIPFFEEVVWRLLLKPTKSNFFLAVGVLLIYIIIQLLRQKYYLCIMFTAYLLSLIVIRQFFKEHIKKIFISHFKWFFWASCVFFGLIHAFNFKGNLVWIITLAPLLGSPQIISGSIIGYIRMNYGFIYGVIFHVLLNSTILINLL